MYKKALKTVTAITLLSGALLGTASGSVQAQGKVDTNFRDVPTSHWSYPAIKDLADKKIIAGYGNGIFGFGDVATREQVAGLVYRVMFKNKQGGTFNGKGYVLKDGSNLRNPYGDINQNSTMFPEEILTLTNAGVFKGDEKGNFRPKDSVNRAEMAQILTNAFHLSAKQKHTFKDVPNGFWGTNAISAVQSNGVAQGTGGGNFEPTNTVTREQYAQFLYNTLKLNQKNTQNKPTNVEKPVVTAEEKQALDVFKKEMKKYTDIDILGYAGGDVFEFKVPFKGTTNDEEKVKKMLLDKYLETVAENGYLANTISGTRYSVSGDSGNYTFTAKLGLRENKEQRDYVRNQSKAIVQAITHSGMSEPEKVKAIHDYIVKHLAYDNSNQSRTTYDALTKRSAVCQGYALLSYQLLKEAGLDVRIVTGTVKSGALHAWNLVKINNKWFHLDTTWDDPIPDRPGKVSYEYFNLSDAQIAKDHNWNRNLHPQANTDYASMNR